MSNVDEWANREARKLLGMDADEPNGATGYRQAVLLLEAEEYFWEAANRRDTWWATLLLSDDVVEAADFAYWHSDGKKVGNGGMRAALQTALDKITKPKPHDSSTTTTGE